MLGTRNQIHGAAHARNHLPRNHPVREVATLIDLQSAKHGHVKMSAPDQSEAHGAVNRRGARHRGHKASSRIGQICIFHAFGRPCTQADHAVFRLEIDAVTRRYEGCNEARQSDAEVDEHARLDLARHAPRDDLLRI